MRQHRVRHLALDILVMGYSALALLGCSDDSNGTSGSDSDGGLDNVPMNVSNYQQYVTEQIRVLCEYTMNCPMSNDDQLSARVKFQSTERCETYYGEMFSRWPNYVDLQRSVESGRIIFDSEQAAEFLSMAYGCGMGTLDTIHSYRAILQGTIAEGEPCYRNEECAGASYCEGGFRSCPGTCIPRKPAGSECDFDDECDDSTGFAECDRGMETGVCVIRPLRNDAQEHEPCGLLETGERVYCASGLWCNGPYHGVGVCRSPIPIGDPCVDIDHPCDGLAFCGADDVNETCQSVTITYEAGGPCDEGGGIRPRMCDPLAGLFCVSGTCELVGDGSENSRCLPGDENELSCQRGLYCSSETDPPTCVPLLPPGSECTGSPGCTFSCDDTTRTCTDRYCGVN